MTKAEFDIFLRENIVLLDGATGSNLQKKGMPSGVCVEQWVCENEESLVELQKEYEEAGSQIVYASTFGANRMKLKEYELENQVEQINKKAVGISRKAVGGSVLVAGDVTMTGQQLEPLGLLKFEELIEAYKEQMKALEEGGADVLVVETMLSLQETRAALIAAREVSALPVMATMSFGEDGKTLYGTDAATAAIVLSSLGASAVGLNCSAGPDKMLLPVQKMNAVTDIPIIAKPNAGMPKLGASGVTEYDMLPEEFAKHMKSLVEAGASVLGGCCGTNPDYIRELKKQSCSWDVSDNNKENEKKEIPVYITSERCVFEWKKDCKIGRISSVENSELCEEWADDIYDTLYDMIDDCIEDEADVLCICVDANEENPCGIIKQVIKEAVSYTSLPLVFQSESPEVLETAVRSYPGRTAIVAMEGQNEDVLAHILKKYGAILV